MCISERRLYILMSKQFAHRVQWDAGDDELRCEGVPQVVPAKMPEAGIREQPVASFVHVNMCIDNSKKYGKIRPFTNQYYYRIIQLLKELRCPSLTVRAFAESRKRRAQGLFLQRCPT